MPESSATARSSVHADSETAAPEPDPFPDWFTAFLHDRQTRKPSAHTMKAYRQDFVAIVSLVTGDDPARLNVVDITKESMRAAFATYAQDHEAASIRRCWSTLGPDPRTAKRSLAIAPPKAIDASVSC